MASPSPVVQKGLSSGGKVFFGSLVCGTFVLGVWQIQRYYEKVTLVEVREEQMQLSPVTTIAQGLAGQHHYHEQFRRWNVSGRFYHHGQVLVGPRGIPPGTLPKSTKARGVMGDSSASAGPQGYFVVTPFEITEEDATSKATRTVMVNRGWIPKEFITSTTVQSTKALWNQPEGIVSIKAIPAKPEVPKWMKPQHDFAKKPPRLLYFDHEVFKVLLGQLHPQLDRHHVTEEDDEVVMLTEIKEDDDTSKIVNKNDPPAKLSFPLKGTAEHVGEYKISPTIHLGYAATWFSMSGAGVYMLRKMITGGRG